MLRNTFILSSQQCKTKLDLFSLASFYNFLRFWDQSPRGKFRLRISGCDVTSQRTNKVIMCTFLFVFCRGGFFHIFFSTLVQIHRLQLQCGRVCERRREVVRRPSTWVAHVARWRWWRCLLRRIVIMIEMKTTMMMVMKRVSNLITIHIFWSMERNIALSSSGRKNMMIILILIILLSMTNWPMTMTTTLKEAEAEEVGSVRDSGSKFFRLALRRGKAGPAEMKRW